VSSIVHRLNVLFKYSVVRLNECIVYVWSPFVNMSIKTTTSTANTPSHLIGISTNAVRISIRDAFVLIRNTFVSFVLHLNCTRGWFVPRSGRSLCVRDVRIGFLQPFFSIGWKKLLVAFIGWRSLKVYNTSCRGKYQQKFYITYNQGRRQKNFREGGNGKEVRKISKKIEKIAPIKAALNPNFRPFSFELKKK